MPVRFTKFALNDNFPPAVIEDAFKAYGAFAGITDFQFESVYEPDMDGWTLDAGLTMVAIQREGEWNDMLSAWDDDSTGWAS